MQGETKCISGSSVLWAHGSYLFNEQEKFEAVGDVLRTKLPSASFVQPMVRKWWCFNFSPLRV